MILSHDQVGDFQEALTARLAEMCRTSRDTDEICRALVIARIDFESGIVAARMIGLADTPKMDGPEVAEEDQVEG